MSGRRSILRQGSLRQGSAAGALVVCLATAPAAAQQSPYCRRVRAQADGDAALLMGPRTVVQALRYPALGQPGLDAAAGYGFQARAGLAFSLVDMYKGTQAVALADARCDVHETSLELERLLTLGQDGPRLAAVRAEAAYLEDHRAEWQELLAGARRRLEAQVITVGELEDLRGRAAALERKRIEALGEANQLAARGAGKHVGPVQPLL